MYADDLILLSSSIYELQTMLDICDKIGNELGIKFNPVKSNCMAIGHNCYYDLAYLTLGNVQLPWADKIEYLGVTILRAMSFQIDLTTIRRKFFTPTNSILSKCTYTSDFVKVYLLESHCLPILLYATERLNLPKLQLSELNSWWNSVYRKIFNYNKWESVKSLISFSGRLDLHHIVNLRTLNFIIKMNQSSNTPISTKFYRNYTYNNSNECTELFKKYYCYKLCNVSMTRTTIYNDLN